MPATVQQNSLSAHLTTRGLHAKALLEANEERINALHTTLKLLEKERHELCGKLQGSPGLTANEINWVFRPASPLTLQPGVSDRSVGPTGNYC
ncbi:MAG: hypothetical protein HQM02_05000 [Magnetococcales bacterium]|nr:hypothetical protein [Magnetococcales bacterium]